MKNIGSFTFYLIIIFAFSTTSAQTLNLQSMPTEKMEFGFIFAKPFYSNNLEFSFFSGVYQFSLSIPISSKLNILSGVPLIISSYEEDYGIRGKSKFDKNDVGNIFIALQTNYDAVENKRSILTFGLYLPTASKEAAVNGLYTDYYNLQKFIPDYLGVYFNYAFHKLNAKGFNFGFELGPNIIIPTEDGSSKTELFIHYGIGAGLQAERLLIKTELNGIFIVSEEAQIFGDRFVNLFNIGALWNGDTVTPELYYRIYLSKNINEALDGVLGIGVKVSID